MISALFFAIMANVTFTAPDSGATVEVDTICDSTPCVAVGAIVGPITPSIAAHIVAYIQQAKKEKANAVVIGISSGGGDFTASRIIFDTIQESDIPVHCYVKNMAASGAFWILQGCAHRVAETTATLMVHSPYIRFSGDAKMRIKDLRNTALELEFLRLLMVTSIAPRMGMLPDAMLSRIENVDWFMTSYDALKYRAIDSIVPLDSFDNYVEKVMHGTITSTR